MKISDWVLADGATNESDEHVAEEVSKTVEVISGEAMASLTGFE